eukprot:SAG31_NODE_2121_length_6404_cov_17.936875_2_plen_154_part_00
MTLPDLLLRHNPSTPTGNMSTEEASITSTTSGWLLSKSTTLLPTNDARAWTVMDLICARSGRQPTNQKVDDPRTVSRAHKQVDPHNKTELKRQCARTVIQPSISPPDLREHLLVLPLPRLLVLMKLLRLGGGALLRPTCCVCLNQIAGRPNQN